MSETPPNLSIKISAGPRPATRLEQLAPAVISNDPIVQSYVSQLEALCKKLETENTIRLRTLEAIVECRCRFAVDPLEHARTAVEHCRELATAGIDLHEGSLEELGVG